MPWILLILSIILVGIQCGAFLSYEFEGGYMFIIVLVTIASMISGLVLIKKRSELKRASSIILAGCGILIIFLFANAISESYYLNSGEWFCLILYLVIYLIRGITGYLLTSK